MEKKIKLFCIPYAGGTKQMYQEFESLLPEQFEVIKIEYAGHGDRRKEPYYNSFQEMTEDTAAQINQEIESGDRIAVFGYSMGSIVAYELMAQKLLKEKPQFIVLASHESPDHEWDSKQFMDLSEEQFFAVIQNMGGFEKCSVDMLNNRFFRKLHFEPVWKDYKLIGDYKMSRKIEMDIPAVLFYSEEDIPTERIKMWQPFLGNKGTIIEIGSSHFFIKEHAQEMIDAILSHVREYD